MKIQHFSHFIERRSSIFAAQVQNVKIAMVVMSVFMMVIIDLSALNIYTLKINDESFK